MTAMMHFHGNRILRNSRRWTWVVSMFNFSSTGSCVIRSLIFESQQTGIGWLCPKWYRYMQAVKFFFGILNLHYRFTCQWLGSTLLIVVFYVLHFAKCFAYNHVSFIVVFHCSRREHLKFKKKYWDNAHEPPIAYWAGALDRLSRADRFPVSAVWKKQKMFLPHPRVKVSIVGSLRDREVACSASDRQGSNFESCVWRAVSSQSSHHPQEVLLAQFSLYVHKGGLKPDSFHFISYSLLNSNRAGPRGRPTLL